jgi:hypothetical protein
MLQQPYRVEGTVGNFQIILFLYLESPICKAVL